MRSLNCGRVSAGVMSAKASSDDAGRDSRRWSVLLDDGDLVEVMRSPVRPKVGAGRYSSVRNDNQLHVAAHLCKAVGRSSWVGVSRCPRSTTRCGAGLVGCVTPSSGSSPHHGGWCDALVGVIVDVTTEGYKEVHREWSVTGSSRGEVDGDGPGGGCGGPGRPRSPCGRRNGRAPLSLPHPLPPLIGGRPIAHVCRPETLPNAARTSQSNGHVRGGRSCGARGR